MEMSDGGKTARTVGHDSAFTMQEFEAVDVGEAKRKWKALSTRQDGERIQPNLSPVYRLLSKSRKEQSDDLRSVCLRALSKPSVTLIKAESHKSAEKNILRGRW